METRNREIKQSIKFSLTLYFRYILSLILFHIFMTNKYSPWNILLSNDSSRDSLEYACNILAGRFGLKNANHIALFIKVLPETSKIQLYKSIKELKINILCQSIIEQIVSDLSSDSRAIVKSSCDVLVNCVENGVEIILNNLDKVKHKDAIAFIIKN